MRISTDARSRFHNTALLNRLRGVFVNGERMDNGVELYAPEDGSEGWVDVLDVEKINDARTDVLNGGELPRIRHKGHVTYVLEGVPELTTAETPAGAPPVEETGTLELHGRRVEGARNRCADCGQRLEVGDVVIFDDAGAHHADGSGCRAVPAISEAGDGSSRLNG